MMRTMWKTSGNGSSASLPMTMDPMTGGRTMVKNYLICVSQRNSDHWSQRNPQKSNTVSILIYIMSKRVGGECSTLATSSYLECL